MSWLTLALGAFAAWNFGRAAHPILFWATVASVIVEFWSMGVMHNFAYSNAAARRQQIISNLQLEGASDSIINELRARPIQLSLSDAQVPPNSVAFVNMLGTVAVIILLIASFIVR